MRILTSFILKSVFVALLVLSMMFSAGSTNQAQAEEAELINILGSFSGSLGFFTDYRYRGLSQTDRHPTIQGSFDWAHEKGYYLGVWGSNVDFGESGATAGQGASIEFDFYGGVARQYYGIDIDLGLLWYTYPGAQDSLSYDFMEYTASIGYSWEILSLSTGVNFAPEFYASSDEATYWTLDAEVNLIQNLTFTGHYGYQWVEDNASYTHPDYADFSIGFAYSTNGFDLSLQYVNTDIEDRNCGVVDACEGDVVFGISRGF